MFGMLVLAAIIIFAVNLAVRTINSPSRIGARGERAVAGRLRNGLPDEYQILNDTYLPLPDGTTTQIDHIVVSQYGIFVVETKTYSGWIFGNENSAKWTQTIYHCKHSFQNPIRQNYRHICALSDNLKIPRDYFKSVVAFTGDCDFRTEMPEGVVYSRKAAQYIRSFTTPWIKPSQVHEIVSAIQAWQGTISEERKSARPEPQASPQRGERGRVFTQMSHLRRTHGRPPSSFRRQALLRLQELSEMPWNRQYRPIATYRTVSSSSQLVVARFESFDRFIAHADLPTPSAAENTLPLPSLALRASMVW